MKIEEIMNLVERVEKGDKRAELELHLIIIKNAYPEEYKYIRETLKYYDEVHVEYYRGEYHASTSITLRSYYPSDFRVIGKYDKTFFEYTEEELKIAREELSKCQWF